MTKSDRSPRMIPTYCYCNSNNNNSGGNCVANSLSSSPNHGSQKPYEVGTTLSPFSADATEAQRRAWLAQERWTGEHRAVF